MGKGEKEDKEKIREKTFGTIKFELITTRTFAAVFLLRFDERITLFVRSRRKSKRRSAR